MRICTISDQLKIGSFPLEEMRKYQNPRSSKVFSTKEEAHMQHEVANTVKM